MTTAPALPRPRPRRTMLKLAEHAFKRLFFFCLQLWFKRGRSPQGPLDPNNIRRVLFLRPDKLGDMIVSLPVFHNLKMQFPQIGIFVLGSPRNEIVIRHDQKIEQVFLYTKNLFRDIVTLSNIRRLGVDVVVDLVLRDSVTSLLLSQLTARDAWRIGLNKFDHAPYYDLNQKAWGDDQPHMLDYTMQVLSFLGLDTKGMNARTAPAIPEKSTRLIESFLISLNGATAQPLIGLNISAGRPSRVWPEGKNRELVSHLLVRYPTCRIIITAEPGDYPRAAELAAGFEHRVTAIPPRLSLLEISALISRLIMLITPDTSLVHIARSFGIPVVGLYTHDKENLRYWHPHGQEGGVVVSNNDYNLFDIGVEEVVRATITLVPPERLA